MTGLKRDYQAIVLGLGGIGAAACYWLSRRLGPEVLGIEQFEPGHGKGGSQDHTRIIRYSYHSPAYVRLAFDAYEAWRKVETESGERLLFETGGLDIFPPGGAIPRADYTDSLEECGVAFEVIDAAELMRRWPHFRVPDGTTGLHQPGGGYVLADRANAAHLRLAREHGAELWFQTEVTGVHARQGEIDLELGGEVVRCRRLVVAAGAWVGSVLPELRLPLTITQEQVAYFAVDRESEFAAGRFPVWIWMDDPCFYGFPYLEGVGVKVAQDVGGETVTVESRSFEPNAANLGRVRAFCREHLPGAVGEARLVKTCLYTLTPDRDFVIDSIPGLPGGSLAVGAGHAFKFASLIGRILSEQALDGTTVSDIRPFSATRPILQEESPPTNFLT